MSHFLDDMRQRVLARVKQIHIEGVEKDIVPSDFCQIFKNKKSPVVISEIKFASPSRGHIYHGSLNHIQIAERYMSYGASALSVLTEPNFFKGEIQYIRDIRAALPNCPILLKDFVLSPVQIKQAQVFGANAILLIVAFLEPSLLRDLYDDAVSLGLTPLIEVHDEAELEQALMLKPKMIGVNNRNLKTMAIDLDPSRRLIRQIPDDVLTVCESGIATQADIEEMTERGFDGFLIGSHMMQTNDPGQALSTLLHRESHAR